MVEPLVIERTAIGSHRLISVSVINSAVMDTLIYTFLCIYPSIPFKQISRSGIPEPRSLYSFNSDIMLNCQQNMLDEFLSLSKVYRASLVAQWLRICLPMQGTRVRALVWEDPTCRRATKPVRHSY